MGHFEIKIYIICLSRLEDKISIVDYLLDALSYEISLMCLINRYSALKIVIHVSLPKERRQESRKTSRRYSTTVQVSL